jgi:hypothetical protein
VDSDDPTFSTEQIARNLAMAAAPPVRPPQVSRQTPVGAHGISVIAVNQLSAQRGMSGHMIRRDRRSPEELQVVANLPKGTSGNGSVQC